MRDRWIRAALVAGGAYFVIGRAFAIPATHVTFWRLAAWVVSGVVYAAQIAYEHFRLRNRARAVAVHAAVGAAIGAFALAVAGFVHSIGGPPRTGLWLLALIAWPVVTAVPAFVVALAVALALRRVAPRPDR